VSSVEKSNVWIDEIFQKVQESVWSRRSFLLSTFLIDATT